MLITLSVSSLFGQKVPKVSHDFSIETSKPYPVVDGSKYYFTSENGEEMYAFKIRRKEIFLQRFSVGKELKQEKATVIDMKEPFSLEAVEEFQGHYYMFYSIYDKPRKTEQLFVKEIDFENLKLASKGKKIISVKGKLSGAPFGSINGFSFGVQDKFDFMKSYDDSKLIVTYRKVPTVKNDSKSKDIIGMVVYEKGLNELWNEDVKMPYTESKMDNLDYAIDNKGNAYIMALVYNSDKAKRYIKGKINYHIELIKVKAGSAEMSASKIDLEGQGINSISLYQDAKDNMVCAGFYNKSRSTQNADGVFVFKLGENGEIKDKISHEIPVSVLNSYVSDRRANKNNKKDAKGGIDFKNLEMRDLVFLEDGSIILTAEQYYVVSHYNSKTGQTTYTYYYNDMLITKIGPKGELVWMEKLGKDKEEQKVEVICLSNIFSQMIIIIYTF